MLPLPSVVVYMGVGLSIAYNPYSTLFHDNPCLFLFVFGVAFAKPTHRIMVRIIDVGYYMITIQFIFINRLITILMK